MSYDPTACGTRCFENGKLVRVINCHDEAVCDHCVALRTRVAELERERDLAIAHDRQPYPTAEAYEKVCEALNKHKTRIATLERALERVNEENKLLWSILKTCPGCVAFVPGVAHGCKIQAHIDLSGHCNQYESLCGTSLAEAESLVRELYQFDNGSRVWVANQATKILEALHGGKGDV